MKEKAMTFWRNVIASQEFLFVRSENVYLNREQVSHNGKTYAIVTSDSIIHPAPTIAGPLVSNRLELHDFVQSRIYLIHARRFALGARLHIELLRKVEPERVVRFRDVGAKTHGYLTVFNSETGLIVSSIMDAQESKGYDDCGVRFDILADGWPALVIDGWLADYSKLKSLSPIECLDYTRRKVEENGGVYGRDEFGRFIRRTD